MKRKLIILLIAISLAGCDKPKTEKPVSEQINEATTELNNKNLTRTIDITVHIKQVDPKNFQASYISAQAHSLSGDVEKALKDLEDALQDGFKDFDDLKTNKNLKELRNVPVFEVVVKKYNPDFSLYSDLSAGDVSIKEGNGKQVIKAGDVSITLPND